MNKSTLRIRLWSLPTLFVFLGVVLLTSLGAWQLTKGLAKQKKDSIQKSRQKKPPLQISRLAGIEDKQINYRKVRIQGELNPNYQFIIEHRIKDGQPGVWLLGVLELQSGGAIVVNRGWVHKQNLSSELDRLGGESSPRKTWEGMIHQPRQIIGDETARKRYEDVTPRDSPLRLNTFDLEFISAATNFDFLSKPTVLLLAPKYSRENLKTGFKSIKEPYLTADRHFGYATFWFGTDIALIAMYLAYGFNLIGYGGRGWG